MEASTAATFDFCEVKMVPIDEIELDPRFNREVIESTIKAIDKDPDPDKFGVIMAARINGHGKYTVYDGGHRFTWLKSIGYQGDVPLVEGRVKDPHVLARKFVDLQLDRKPVNPWERYRKLLYAGDPMMVAIDRAVEGVGWRVGPKAVEYVVMPKPLERMFARIGEDGIAETLELDRDLWNGKFKSTDSNVLEGLATVVAELGANLDRGRFIAKLEHLEPSDLLMRARERRARERGTIAKNVAREIMRAYRTRSGSAQATQ